MSAVSLGRAVALRPRAIAILALAAALIAGGIWMARLSMPASGAAALLLLPLMGYAATRWPRATLVLVALSAILDRYVVAGLLPTRFGDVAHFWSEALLAVVGIVLTWQAWRAGRLVWALRHEATFFLAVFVVLALLSAVVNRVPPVQAIAGLVFTLDAVVLFFLVRMVGFDVRQALLALGALVALLVVAGLIAILQAVIRPDLFGLTALAGRFGEPHRLASVFGDPNVFGALISAAAPFAVLAAARAPRRRFRWTAFVLSFVLALALWLSFSRGGWLGMLVGFSVATLVLDRKAFLVGAAALMLGLVTAGSMPRDLGVPVANGQQAHQQSSDSGGFNIARVISIALPQDVVESTVDRVGTVNAGRDLRTLLILNALPILADHPVLGVGPGRYGGAAADLFGSPIYAQYNTDTLIRGSQRTADNFWLHLLVESGVVGALAFLGVILTVLVPVFRRAWESRVGRRILLVGIAAAAMSLVVNSVTTMLLESNSVAYVFWFLMGIGSVIVSTPVADAAGRTAPAHQPAGPAGQSR